MPDFEKYCRCPGCGQCEGATMAPKLLMKIEGQNKTIKSLATQLHQLKAEQDDVIRRADVRIGWHAQVRRQIEGALDQIKVLLHRMEENCELDQLDGMIQSGLEIVDSIKPPNRDLP